MSKSLELEKLKDDFRIAICYWYYRGNGQNYFDKRLADAAFTDEKLKELEAIVGTYATALQDAEIEYVIGEDDEPHDIWVNLKDKERQQIDFAGVEIVSQNVNKAKAAQRQRWQERNAK